ncbi:ankyrin repeat domain-containing protein [Sphingomonas sp.]|jgi:ankyrin repeat protein|uniref:ankyrin repeat domain-containing protein n=1 Tax=Sphingomonas sp. TaxID=28214 RepID=UPI0035C840EB
MRNLLLPTLVFASLITPASAQIGQSKGYKFLEAVKSAKGQEVIDMLDEPGQTIINTKDISSGEGALHIVVKRQDLTYLKYLLSRGADANLRDARGNTPLLLAVQYGQVDMIPVLTNARANPNLANASGETPLIRAVQKRDLALVRALLAVKANPDQTDNVAGMSARDYAHADDRSPAIAKLIDETPKSAAKAVAGPRF